MSEVILDIAEEGQSIRVVKYHNGEKDVYDITKDGELLRTDCNADTVIEELGNFALHFLRLSKPFL